jgi:hypothetical protein
VVSRETIKEWPLLTVKTDVDRDSKSTNERGLFGWFVGLSCWYKRFCSTLAALVGPVQNIFSSPYTISIP